MDKYLEAEKRLAELLGWVYVPPQALEDYVWLHQPSNEWVDPPPWCRDDAAAFKLMVEHGAQPSFYDDETMVDFRSAKSPVRHEARADHPDRETAVRYAIVQAVIAKLEGEK